MTAAQAWWKCALGFAASLETRNRVDEAAAAEGLTRSAWLRQAALEKLARAIDEQQSPSLIPDSTEKEFV